MQIAVLYSAGKDSTLAALLCERFYEVRLVTVHFGVTDAVETARETAATLDFPFEAVELDREVAVAAVETMREDGYPRNGIQAVHEHAVERVAEMDVDAVADGTRRDDRVPTVSRAFAQHVEDTAGVDYVAPLSGFGRGAVDRLAAATLEVESGPSEGLPKADYEAELRAVLAAEYDEAAVAAVFPEHVQTRVTGMR